MAVPLKNSDFLTRVPLKIVGSAVWVNCVPLKNCRGRQLWHKCNFLKIYIFIFFWHSRSCRLCLNHSRISQALEAIEAIPSDSNIQGLSDYSDVDESFVPRGEEVVSSSDEDDEEEQEENGVIEEAPEHLQEAAAPLPEVPALPLPHLCFGNKYYFYTLSFHFSVLYPYLFFITIQVSAGKN